MKSVRILWSLFVAVSLITGCAHTPAPGSAKDLFGKVKIGMTRAEVDRILGPPSTPQPNPEGEAWYLRPPNIAPNESPFAPGTIGIHFTADGKVASKRLNPQLGTEVGR